MTLPTPPYIRLPQYLRDFFDSTQPVYSFAYDRLKRRLGETGGVGLELIRPIDNQHVDIPGSPVPDNPDRENLYREHGLVYVICDEFTGYVPMEWIEWVKMDG